MMKSQETKPLLGPVVVALVFMADTLVIGVAVTWICLLLFG